MSVDMYAVQCSAVQCRNWIPLIYEQESHACIHAHTCAHACVQARTRAYARTRTHVCTHALAPLARMHARTVRRHSTHAWFAHTHAHALMHARMHSMHARYARYTRTVRTPRTHIQYARMHARYGHAPGSYIVMAQGTWIGSKFRERQSHSMTHRSYLPPRLPWLPHLAA